MWVSLSSLTFNTNWHHKERRLLPFIFSFQREFLHVHHTLAWNQTLQFSQLFLTRQTHLLFILTYETLVIGYRSHCGVDVVQYGFGFVSSCLNLRCQENFLSFLLLSFQGYFIQQYLNSKQRRGGDKHRRGRLMPDLSMYLISFGSILFWAQADLALWANDSHKHILEAVLVAHTDFSSVLTRHPTKGPDAAERHPWTRSSQWEKSHLRTSSLQDRCLSYIKKQMTIIIFYCL